MNESIVKLKARATWTHDLSPSERCFLATMNELGLGRFELLRIRRGELLLDPWPKAVRAVRFGPQDPSVRKGLQNAFELRPTVRQFFEYVRSVVDGEILRLECRHGLPFSMEIEHRLTREYTKMSAPRNVQLPVDERTGSALSDADYASLNRRWIDNDLADAARIRRVDSDIGRTLIGRSDYGSYDGLAIPYFLPGEVDLREWRLRRDRPDMEFKNGKPKERGKYLSPPGRKNMLYFVPGISTDLLKDISVPVIVTEGEFKTLALWRLANHESDSPQFLPLGLAGAWNWRGTIGKATGPDGDRRDVKGVIPDVELVVWEGRRVIIAFDADAARNEDVDIARNLFARELRMRGGEVSVVSWDITQGKGIDDLLATIGPEKVLELLNGADFEKEKSEDNVSIHEVAEAITARNRFAQDAGGRLYVFRGGSYHANGAAFVRQQVKQLLERMRLSSKWTSHKAEEVVRYIEIDAPRLWDQPKVDVVNVLNGLLDVTTWVLLPHSPDFLSPVQLPVKFDPNARCPTWRSS